MYRRGFADKYGGELGRRFFGYFLLGEQRQQAKRSFGGG
jgi:hypothetical protein